MNFLEPIFEAIAQLFDFITSRQTLKNNAEMKANADAALIAKDKEQAVKDVNSDNLDQLRKDVAE
jgi:hypothetical protein